MPVMHFDRFYRVVFASAILLGAGISGCSGESQLPHNPALEIVNNPSTETSHENVTEQLILIDGVRLEEGAIVVFGDDAHITGTMTLDLTQFEGGVGYGSLYIRIVPTGTTEEDWRSRNQLMEYSMEWSGMIRDELDFHEPVDAPPGEYDARAYAMLHGPYEDLPRFDLIARGNITVIANSAVN